MDEEARRAVVAALVKLATSSDFTDRAAAGRALAGFADVVEARETLLRLVLDPGDTFVTRATAQALLQRQDSAGLTLVAAALAAAEPGHADWITTAVLDVFAVYGSDRDAAARVCETLVQTSLRSGATQLLDTLIAIDPVLPARDS